MEQVTKRLDKLKDVKTLQDFMTATGINHEPELVDLLITGYNAKGAFMLRKRLEELGISTEAIRNMLDNLDKA